MVRESKAAFKISGEMQAADGPDKREAREVTEVEVVEEGEGVGRVANAFL